MKIKSTRQAIEWLIAYGNSPISCGSTLRVGESCEVPWDERAGDAAMAEKYIKRALKLGMKHIGASSRWPCLICNCNPGVMCNAFASVCLFSCHRTFGLWLAAMEKGFGLGWVEWNKIMRGEQFVYIAWRPVFPRRPL